MIRLLMLAPPGGGKTTQGRRLSDHFNVPHISTGELLREHVNRSTPIGTAARPFIEKGDLVPDELALAVVRQRICEPFLLRAFVLDGFPRTLNEATVAYRLATEHRITFSAVIHLIVSDAEVMRRLLARGRESSRDDDREDTVLHRLERYRNETAPLLDFYRGRGLLVEVDGEGPVVEVTERAELALADRHLTPPTS
jgi:adenylate kinase